MPAQKTTVLDELILSFVLLVCEVRKRYIFLKDCHNKNVNRMHDMSGVTIPRKPKLQLFYENSKHIIRTIINHNY